MSKDCKKKKKVAPLQPLPVISKPFVRVAMDFVGPLPLTRKGKQYIIILVDYATHWPEAQAVTNTGSKIVAEFLAEVFNHLGTPDEFLTDRSSGFISSMLKHLYKMFEITSITTTPYHLQTDGVVEHLNGTVKTMLKQSLTNFEGQWDLALPFIM